LGLPSGRGGLGRLGTRRSAPTPSRSSRFGRETDDRVSSERIVTVTGPGAATVRWRLFIDETGRFSDPVGDVAIAGLLVRCDVAASSSARLRTALVDAAPDLPWPIHTAYLNVPVMAALTRHASTRTGRARTGDAGRDPDLGGLVERAIICLRGRLPDVFAKVVEQIAEGSEPPLEAVKDLDRELRHGEPSVHRALDDRVRHAASLIVRVIRALGRVDSRSGTDVAVAVVVAAEPYRSPVTPSGAEEDRETVRYLELLECFLERTADVLGHLGGPHHVWLNVLNRPIRDPILGVRTVLFVRHVHEVARRVIETRGDLVRLVVEAVPPFDDRAHAALVLADFIANRSRQPLAGATTTLAEVERQLTTRVGAALRSGTPQVSHLAASGIVRDHLNAARAGNPPPPLASSETKRWAREQAAEWAGVVWPRA